MSRDLPEGWSQKRLGDVCEIGGGVGFKEAMQGRRDLPFPFIKVSDMNDPGNETEIRSARNYVDAEMLKAMGAKLFPKGSVVLPKVGAAALTNKRRQLAKPTAVDNNLMVWTPSSIDPSFLLHWSSTIDVASLVQTGALPSLNKTIAENIQLILPPLHEQRRIAEILSSVDEAIAATRAVIEQTRKVKQGVLERLLTKGIGHTRFKQTEIGEIPEGWELATLEELLADIPNPMRSGPFGSALKSEELVDSGVPFLGIDNIQVEQFIRNYKRFLSEDKFRQLRRFAVNPNDVVITIMGTVGRCCVIPPDIGEAVSSKHIWAMSLNRERYIAELACWQMNFAPWIVSKFTRSAQGGIMSAINSGILRKLVFPVPGLEERRQIFQVWQSFQSELEVEQAKLQNLENLKSALMSDLLTGRKRVTDALPMAAE